MDANFCYKIPVRGSDKEPYTVSVESGSLGIYMTCNCDAGIYSKICKHKRAVIIGDKSLFANATQWGFDPDDYQRARLAMDAAGIPEILQSYDADITFLDKEIEVLKTYKVTARRAIQRKLRDGI